MKDKKLYELYLNWKELEFIHSLKYLSKIVLIFLSIAFVIVSVKINNIYFLLASLIVLFLQILSENNQEHYLKYKEIFEKIDGGKKYSTYKEWINFLEKTKGMNSLYRWFFGLYFKKRFNELA